MSKKLSRKRDIWVSLAIHLHQFVNAAFRHCSGRIRIMNYDIIYNIVEKGEEGRKFSSITLYNGGENIECTGP